MFQDGGISSPKFGQQIIRLFNEAGFNKKFAEDNFDSIEEQDWSDDLLFLNVQKYLISSGPSYYVKTLAKKYSIPIENVLCSNYSFGSDGKLNSCKAVNSDQKRNFVNLKARKHFLSIGVGDSPTHDGAFLSECDIGILTIQYPGYLYAESLSSVISIITKLSRHTTSVPRSAPSAFIGSSVENLGWAEALHQKIDRICEPTIWTDGIFKASKTNIENLECSLSEFDFAIFIMSPDDVAIVRGTQKPAIRDNIIFELGLFMGRLGRRRCLLLYPRSNKPELPSDLDGVVMLDYVSNRSEEQASAALTPAAKEIKQIISDLGCRGYKL